jgi:hypothetical protein
MVTSTLPSGGQQLVVVVSYPYSVSLYRELLLGEISIYGCTVTLCTFLVWSDGTFLTYVRKFTYISQVTENLHEIAELLVLLLLHHDVLLVDVDGAEVERQDRSAICPSDVGSGASGPQLRTADAHQDVQAHMVHTGEAGRHGYRCNMRQWQ